MASYFSASSYGLNTSSVCGEDLSRNSCYLTVTEVHVSRSSLSIDIGVNNACKLPAL